MTATFPRREIDPVAVPEVKDLEGRVAVLEEGGGGVTPEELEAEETARVKGDGDEKARAVAAEKVLGEGDVAEAKVRAEADSDEAKARKEADESETGARKAADTTLTAAAAAAQATANAALPKAGGTMLGVLTLAEDPKSALAAATRQYVLAQYAALVNGAPEALDTLKELGEALKAAEESDSSADKALTALVETKLSKAENLKDLADPAVARTNLGLGTAAVESASAFDTAGAAKAVASPYRRIAYMQGRATTSAVGETKYICSGGSDVTALGVGSTAAFLVPITSADLAIIGLKAKLRVKAIIQSSATAPGTAIEISLAKATIGSTIAAGENATDASFEIPSPAKETAPISVGTDFEVPADGDYLLTYKPITKPAASFIVHAYLELRYV